MDVFKEVFTTHGRLNRELCIKYELIWTVLNMLAGFTSSNMVAFITGSDALGNVIIGVLFYIWFIGTLMITARRLHDLGRDGRFALLLGLPGIGIIFAFYILFAKGQISSNKYGNPPDEN